MYSKIVPFETILDGVKDDTGITTLRSILPKIRRLVYRCEKDMGFGSTAILKKILYSVADGSIIVSDDGKTKKIRLPEDILALEEVGLCAEGVCPGTYIIQGNYLFFCNEIMSIEEFHLVYYTLLCDGEGNPLSSENHHEAVIAGVSYWLYKPRRWQDKGSRQQFKDLEDYYHDRLREAIGNDIMPSTSKEWSKIAARLRHSYRDTLMYDPGEKCFCALPISENPTGTDTNIDAIMYYWQYEDLSTNIDIAPFITQEFLDAQNYATIQSFINGQIVNYSKIGRIAFAIKNIPQDTYRIYDVLGTDITDVVFDTYYNTELTTQIYISKEYYSHGSIYFKLT